MSDYYDSTGDDSYQPGDVIAAFDDVTQVERDDRALVSDGEDQARDVLGQLGLVADEGDSAYARASEVFQGWLADPAFAANVAGWARETGQPLLAAYEALALRAVAQAGNELLEANPPATYEDAIRRGVTRGEFRGRQVKDEPLFSTYEEVLEAYGS